MVIILRFYAEYKQRINTICYRKLRLPQKLLVLRQPLFLCTKMHQMRDRRNTLFLHNGSRTEQRACRNKQNIAKQSLLHFTQDITTQHRRTAPTAGTACVNILVFIKDHHTAVAVTLSQINALFRQQVPQQPRSYPSEITGIDHIIVTHTACGCLQITIYGVRRSRC